MHYRDPASNIRRSGPTTFATKADASRWLAQAQTELGLGTHIDSRSGNVTLSEYTAGWRKTKPTSARRQTSCTTTYSAVMSCPTSAIEG